MPAERGAERGAGSDAGPFDGPVERAALLDRIDAHPLGDDPAAMRRTFDRLVLGDGGPDLSPDGVTVRADGTGLRVAPHGRAEDGAPPDAIWLHGGGYVFGSPETHLRAAAQMARTRDLDVALPRYRLAPEHVWPAPLDDALAAIATLAGDGPAPVLIGDSAGGHLALVTALTLARAGRQVRGLVLFSPNTDRTGRSRTRQAMDGDDPMVDDAGDRRLAEMCFHGRADDDPAVSPLLDDLSLLPPTWIEVGEPEVLLDDSRLLTERALRLGADVRLRVTPGLLHMGQLWAPWWDPATTSLDRAAAFVRDVEGDLERA